MKKTVRILAMFMAAVLLMCSLPINSFAAKGFQSIDISIDIAPGVAIKDYENYFSINSDGVELYQYYDNDVIFVSEEFNYAYGVFEFGVEYYFDFYLVAEKGYSLPHSEFEFDGVFINGEEAYYETFYDEDLELEIMYVSFSIPLPGAVADVALTIDAFSGMYTDDFSKYINIDTRSVDFFYGNFDTVYVTDDEGNNVGIFEAGKNYTIEIFLEPSDICYFEKDDNGNPKVDNVTVNGEDAEYYVDSYNVNGYYEYVKVVAHITAKASKYIDSISFDLDTDLDGVKVSDWEDYITIKSDGICFEDYLGNPAVYASNSAVYSVDSFEKGDIYYLEIFFRPEYGYFFPDDGVFDSVTVNGTDAYDGYYFGSYTAYDGEDIEYVCIEIIVDLVGDGFFDQLMFRIKFFFIILREYFISIFNINSVMYNEIESVPYFENRLMKKKGA